MSNPYLAILVNHLWQSTLFVVAIWGLTLLLRRNSARARYSLWLAASLKFLLPFALLAAIGTQIPWNPEPVEQGAVASRVLNIAGDFAVPVAGEIKPVGHGRPDLKAAPSKESLVAIILLLVWSVGALFVAIRWLVRWREIRRALRSSTAVAGIEFPAPVRATSMRFEPGVVGIVRPALLLPAGIEERLTPEQMRAVLAHERCHLRWRDNLTATLHMLVEMVFWFHPMVWWIGKRLIEERERACDEQVIRDGCAPQSYAEGILAVCEHYIASRLPCVSGVSGADLRQRVERILKNTLSLQLGRTRKLVLAAIACCSVAAPIVAGMYSGSLQQVAFALSPRTAAEVQFSRLQSSLDQLNLRGLPPPLPPAAERCRAPGARAIRQQNALAATVRTLSAGDSRNVLLYAVAANTVPDLQRLLASGAPRNGDQFTDHLFTEELSLMHFAAMLGDTRMMEALSNAGFGIDNAKSVKVRNEVRKGGTPLMFAVTFGRSDNVEWLIQKGADVNADTATDISAIGMALNCRNPDMVARLLKAGALPNPLAILIANDNGMDLRGSQPWHAPAREPTDISADFDGDGALDRARLLVSADGRREGLFVQLASRGADHWIHAAEANSVRLPMAPMGISVAIPGTRATACAKGHGRPCSDDEPAALVLERPAIDFHQEEGASSILYWDEKSRRFERAWISD